MFCTNCGTQNENSAKFCIKCGHSLALASALSRPVSARLPQSKHSPAHSGGQLKKVWRAACILLLVVMGLLAVCAIWYATRRTDSAVRERVREIDGMVMVFVPGGDFLMGSTDAQVQDAITQCLADGNPDWVCEVNMEGETPQHTVMLDAFWIDKTEVTNSQYDICVMTGVCRKASCRNMEGADGPKNPVVCVTWDDAKTYCEWAGGRLPTEEEWEKAARGTDGRLYPWGNVFDGSKVNYCDRNCGARHSDTSVNDGYGGSAPVGSYPEGASPYGALDMAGNVEEWVDDWRDSLSGMVMLRGGAWHQPSWGVRTAFRSDEIIGGSHWVEGFRCMTP